MFITRLAAGLCLAGLCLAGLCLPGLFLVALCLAGRRVSYQRVQLEGVLSTGVEAGEPGVTVTVLLLQHLPGVEWWRGAELLGQGGRPLGGQGRLGGLGGLQAGGGGGAHSIRSNKGRQVFATCVYLRKSLKMWSPWRRNGQGQRRCQVRGAPGEQVREWEQKNAEV